MDITTPTGSVRSQRPVIQRPASTPAFTGWGPRLF
jgi:hypothetical protein